MERGLALGLAFVLMLCVCTGQTEVKTIPTTIASAVQNISPKASSMSVLVSNIDVDKLTYQNLCPSGVSSGFILINNRYSVLHCTRSDNIYLFLQESIVGQEDSRLIDVMRIPRKSNKDALITMMNCNYQGQDPVSRESLANFFILARELGNGDFKVMRVWRVNFLTRHFEPLSPHETSLISSCERSP